jgi:hypothetical protein
MEAIFSQLIAQLNSSVFVLLGILVIAALALYKLGRWQERFKTHDRRVDKIESIHEKVVILETKIQLIYDNTNPRKTLAAASPIALTAFGKEIANKIGAEKIFKRYLQKLLGKATTKCPLTANAYDIQVESMKIAKEDLRRMVTAEEINLIKNEAFERGILDEDIWAIFGIYLRDHILNARGISAADIDNHDPMKQSGSQ